jgi:hypothetical protein
MHSAYRSAIPENTPIMQPINFGAVPAAASDFGVLEAPATAPCCRLIEVGFGAPVIGTR